jgi:hypothetical protein
MVFLRCGIRVGREAPANFPAVERVSHRAAPVKSRSTVSLHLFEPFFTLRGCKNTDVPV